MVAAVGETDADAANYAHKEKMHIPVSMPRRVARSGKRPTHAFARQPRHEFLPARQQIVEPLSICRHFLRRRTRSDTIAVASSSSTASEGSARIAPRRRRRTGLVLAAVSTDRARRVQRLVAERLHHVFDERVTRLQCGGSSSCSFGFASLRESTKMRQ